MKILKNIGNGALKAVKNTIVFINSEKTHDTIQLLNLKAEVYKLQHSIDVAIKNGGRFSDYQNEREYLSQSKKNLMEFEDYIRNKKIKDPNYKFIPDNNKDNSILD